MTTYTSTFGRLPAFAFVTIATLLMTACSSGPSVNTSQPSTLPQHQSIDQRLILAARTLYPERARLTLDITKELLFSSPEQVKTLLDEMPYDELPRDIQARLAVQQATIAQIHKKNWEVFEWLDQEPVISSNDPEIMGQSHILKALTYSRFGEFKAALDEWLLASPLLSEEQKTAYYDSFWQTLLHAPRTTLESLYDRETSSSLRGWLSLAMIYQSENPLDQQLASLQQWRSQWPAHPAAAYLPDNFDSIRASALQKPQKIAILLPLSGGLGKAGRSVRDGIITAHYEAAMNSQEQQPELQFYNTHNAAINNLAQQAMEEGAQLIIGPLSKANVRRLQAEPAPGIPLLALNYANDKVEENQGNSMSTTLPPPRNANLYQFGLSAEDEAQMAAHRGKLDGHRRAIVITPDSDWGRKVSQTFINTWQTLDGEVIASAEFNASTQFSQMTGKLLHTDQSEARARQLSRQFGEKLGFQAHRRQDVDMVFIGANPEEARQIKPALAYQYAGNVPVYATSNAFSGRTNPSQDQDMNGIRIPVMPWLTPGTTSQLEQKINKLWPQSRSQYGSLFALGVDAYHLYPRLQQLISLQGSQIQGLTGSLSISPDGKIHRELSWQLFRGGRLTPLPIPRQINGDLSNL